MIDDYFLEIETIIKEFFNIRSLTLKKKIYSSKQGYISGSIVFDNCYRLDFIEVKDIDIKSKVKYSYHYMDDKQNLVFRYDNAPHHADIKTFPHHKHEKDAIKSSLEPTLEDILMEIFRIQKSMRIKYETNS
ncbi:MAG: hypothetical protein HQK64_13245 [Desulfamplus sp.]|nr:hypothetical protein [Desulfamplus sp.]MBF0243424.1 hypothetical protein [Desulfamplus sp.]